MIEQIERTFPELEVSEIQTQYGRAILIKGRGAKVVANLYARENYYDGNVDTIWRNVRHGIGYLVPMYNNPMNDII